MSATDLIIYVQFIILLICLLVALTAHLFTTFNAKCVFPAETTGEIEFLLNYAHF